MSLQKLTAFACALLILASCKKHGADASGNSNKLKWYIENYTSGTNHLVDSFSVSYDNSDRITGLSSALLKLVYGYANSKTNTFDIYEYGQPSLHENAFVNGNALVDSSIQYDYTGDTTTQKYVYNGTLLTRDITYDYSHYGSSISSVDDYTYDNNANMIKDVTSDGYGTIQTISTFTYTTHPVNVTINPAFFPQQSKFLPDTQKQTDGGGNLIATVSYTYTFDGAGRLTKETDVASDGEIVVKTYVYQ
jgi:YD repeat-containing protein